VELALQILNALLDVCSAGICRNDVNDVVLRYRRNYDPDVRLFQPAAGFPEVATSHKIGHDDEKQEAKEN
jgi:hypothetical protein